MARDFTANTSNYMTLGANALGPVIHGASVISFNCHVSVDTYPTNGTNGRDIFFVPIDGLSSGLSFSLARISSVNRLRVGGRSVISDTFRSLDSTAFDAAGGTHWAGCVWDFAGDNLRIYMDGSQVASGTSGVFANTTYTNGTPTAHDAIGCATGGSTPISNARQMDGRISECGLWLGDIGTEGFAQLAKGLSAMSVSPGLLALYMPLIGQYSPETDLVGGLSGTITGSLPAMTHISMYRSISGQAVADDAPSATFQAAWARGSNVILGVGTP